MKVEKNKVVVITYDLHVEGELIDSATEKRPLDYIQGGHMLIPRFELELEGKQEGDSFAFSIPAAEGYGEYEPKLRFDIPKQSFAQDGKIREDLLVPGKVIPMLNGAGEVCRALIVEIKEDSVTVDFNHPMAGKVLDFTGRILSVRNATEKELLEGLHGEFLPSEEGHCHCGRHGKGGCHGGKEGEEGCGCHGGCGEGEDGCHGGCGDGNCGGEGGCGGHCGESCDGECGGHGYSD